MKSRYAGVLTHREQEVISLISSGLTNDEIARQLDLSLDGVKYHVSEILKRLGAENRRDAVALHQTRDQETSERKSRLTRGLTPREQEVISLLSSGLTNDEIARQLELSLDGVKYHVSEILKRLGAENRHDAVAVHLSAGRSGRLATLAPVMFLRKLPFAWLPKAAAGAVLTAAAAGIALLAWGVLSTSSDAVATTGCTSVEQSATNAAPCAPGVVQAPAGADAVSAISASGAGQFLDVCALKGGGVWCWSGYYIGDPGFSSVSPVPMAVPGLASGVSAITAGGAATCAVKDGGAWCWGSNEFGQLGNSFGQLANNTMPESGMPVAPVAVSGLAGGVTAISAGGSQVCAVKDGGAWCWGGNAEGQLGDDIAPWNSEVPVAVLGLESGVSAISAGYYHTCALKDGGVWCWGNNTHGQIGNNSTAEADVAVAVSGLERGVSAISAGESHTCALKDSGAWCWGRNGQGELYDNNTTESHVPVAVSELASGVSAISGTCAVKEGGAWCWSGDSWVPLAVPGLASGVSAIDGHCALKDGSAFCWGGNSFGGLGNGTTTDSPVPVAVQFPPPSAGDIAAEPDAKPLSAQTSADSAGYRGAYVLGGTAAAALAIVTSGMWAVRRRHRSRTDVDDADV